jgi:predicted HicB family RNase H-like nuclease
MRQHSECIRQGQTLSSAAGLAGHGQAGLQTMNIKHYSYRVMWSPEDDEHVALCAEFPSLSWLAKTPGTALKGIQKAVTDVVADMEANGEAIPQALAEKHDGGEFRVRIPPQLHCSLALTAAAEGVSLNRLASAKLAA